MNRRKLRELGNDVVGGAEKNSRIGLAEHGRVVIRIARGDHLEIELVEGFHRLALLVFHAEVVVRDFSVRADAQPEAGEFARRLKEIVERF